MPGDILFFAGSRDGFEKPVVIPERVDKRDEDFQMATATPIDWDGDGDFDLLVGSLKGGVFVNLNEGTPTEYRFGERKPLRAAGKPLRVIQKSDPIPVDWDGDQVLDLLVGDEAAGVTFFKGRTDRTFAAGVSVFSGKPVPHDDYYELRAWWDEESGFPGFRLRLAVADWNEDGKLDLLIGNCEPGEREGDLTGHVYLLLRL